MVLVAAAVAVVWNVHGGNGIGGSCLSDWWMLIVVVMVTVLVAVVVEDAVKTTVVEVLMMAVKVNVCGRSGSIVSGVEV